MLKCNHFHFLGIGGIGVSALAEFCLKGNCRVSGSDISYSQNIARLEKLGATVFIGHDKKNIHDNSIIVYSTAISKDNPEILEAKKRGLRIIHRSVFISEFFSNKKIVSITGSCGKTTTVALTASIFLKAGLDPTVIIGGILNHPYNTNVIIGDGEWLILESDESDGTMVNINPDIAVITNIFNDHLDYYVVYDNIKKELSNFLKNLRANGSIILEDSVDIDVPAIRYGDSKNSDFKITKMVNNSDGSIFSLRCPNGDVIEDIFLPMAGKCNVFNAVAAASVAITANVDYQSIKDGISSFFGVVGRFTILGKLLGVTFIADQAVHPEAIMALAESAKCVASGKVICVIRPYRFVRLSYCFEEFIKACLALDTVVLMDVQDYSDGVCVNNKDVELLQSEVKKLGKKDIFRINDANKIMEFVLDRTSAGDVVLFVGQATGTRELHKEFFRNLSESKA